MSTRTLWRWVFSCNLNLKTNGYRVSHFLWALPFNRIQDIMFNGGEIMSNCSHQSKRMVFWLVVCGNLPESQCKQREVCWLGANATIPKSKFSQFVSNPVCSTDSCHQNLPKYSRRERKGPGKQEKSDSHTNMAETWKQWPHIFKEVLGMQSSLLGQPLLGHHLSLPEAFASSPCLQPK